MISLPVHNIEAEQAVLGAVLLVDTVLDSLTRDLGLRPEHFFRVQHAEIFTEMQTLAREGQGIDTLTVIAALRAKGKLEAAGGPATVDVLAGAAPAAGNVRDYAKIVLADARWRSRQLAVSLAEQAIYNLDEEAFAEAQGALQAPQRERDRLVSGDMQGEALFAEFESGATDAIPMPFERLNIALGDGLDRGHCTVIATWTSWGKSVLTAQFLRFADRCGLTTCCYSNEMTAKQYARRAVADISGVPFSKIKQRRLHHLLTHDERTRLVRSFGQLRVPVMSVAGWRGHDIANHIRASKWDLWALDYIHKVPYDTVSELDQIFAALTSAAVQTNSHGLIVAQLNQERNRGGELPRPVRRDLRGSGSLQFDPANILMISRDQEEVVHNGYPTGVWRPLPGASLYFEKHRDGEGGGIPASFDKRRMIFTEEAV